MPPANNPLEPLALIGKVACNCIRELLNREGDELGTARLALHRLGVEETAAVAVAVSQEPDLSARVEVALPAYRMTGLPGITEAMLTSKSATELRTTHCDKGARLFALFDDSQEQGLAQVTKVNKDLLLDAKISMVWVEEAVSGLSISLTDAMKQHWAAALSGLFQLDRLSLRDAAAYVCETRTLIDTGGLSIKKALGTALSRLRLPSFANAFETITDQKLTFASEWRRKFATHWANQCYLLKRNKQQAPYSKQALQESLAKAEEQLPPLVKVALQQFIDAGDGWTPASSTLSQLEWADVQPFFETVGRPEAQTIGERTKAFFQLKDPELLDASEWDYIEGLIARGKKPVKGDEDTQFYLDHQSEIQTDDPALAAVWDRFVFGNEVCCNNFEVGLLECIRRLMPARRSIPGRMILEVTGEESEKIKFKLKNELACRYFQKQYAGLESLLAGVAEFRKLLAFQYDGILKELEDLDSFKPDSTAKKALQLGFRVVLKSSEDEEKRTQPMRLLWAFDLNSVLGGYAIDLGRMADFAAKRKRSPLVRCQATRDVSSNRGVGNHLSLTDVSGFSPTGRSERGSFVPAISRAQHLGTEWETALSAMAAKGFVTAEFQSELKGLFKAFEDAFTAAIVVLQGGMEEPAKLLQQAEHYSSLLRAVCLKVKADEARRSLLRPLLEIGVASVGGMAGSDPASVVCPWHPVRMQAMAATATRFCETVALLLAEEPSAFTDGSGDFFFREETEALEACGGPETIPHWRGAEPTILSLSDAYHAYSLHEAPVSGPDQSLGTHENPSQTAGIISEVVNNYLTLQPHERDNFSVVLYNCDSVPLPQAVVESIRSASENDHDAMCQVILTHSVRSRLRELYQRIAGQEGEDDAFHVSESSKDFMARVRINIMVEEAPEPDPKSGQPTDVVFCQDVISRHAELGWAKANRAAFTFPAASLRPHQWSRRRELQRGDRESIVYLACPAQTEEGWSYLLALSTLCDPEIAVESWNAGFCRIPARKLNFDKEETSQIFQQTHALGNWVVNLDELLDRRLLRDRKIKVIRYKQTATQGRNLIISSTASDALLRATIHNKLRDLVPSDTPADQFDGLCNRFIEEANDISGHLVLRAAKRGNSTNELLGLVLSTFLVRRELGETRDIACFLLDDYAYWLGQSEEKVADLLILSPRLAENGEKLLDVVVTESKFIKYDKLADMAGKSAKQLRDTLKRLEAALFGDPAPADQGIWLARLADLLLEGLQRGAGSSGLDVTSWRAAIRRRECKVCLRGYSHVFVHSPQEHDTEGDKYVRVKETSEGHQECFSRSTVRSLIKSFLNGGADPEVNALRTTLAGHDFAAREYRAVSAEASVSAPKPKTKPKAAAPKPPKTEPAQPAPQPPVQTAPPGAPEVPPAPPAIPQPAPEPQPPAPVSASCFAPGLQLLLDGYQPAAGAVDQDAGWLDAVANRTRVALQKRGMTAKLLEKRLTPNAALLKFQGTDDLTIPKLEAKLSELKTTDGIDIIGIRPELGKIAISITRPHRQVLHLQEVWKRWHPNVANGNTQLLVGIKEEDNELLFLSPDPQPHSLTAGETGSGKSVLIQNILLAIAATNTPEQARIRIIDPKLGVDYFPFNGLPHLLGPTITTKDAALACLEELVQEMNQRYQLFHASQAPNLSAYMARTGQVLPRLWVVHDEFALWMQEEDYREHVDGLVNQLSVAARAAGIYLIFAAQRPDNTVFPMQLRSNLGNRLVLKVDTEGTSEVSLGIKKGGAERLLGNGHLAARVGGSPDIVLAQVPFISTDDIQAMVAAIQAAYEPAAAQA